MTSAAALPERAYLFADPAAHSLSPRMHNAAFAYAGLRGEYQAMRVPANELPAKIAELRQPSNYGANLSLPHKETVLPLLDDLTPAAQRIGAVNTVVNHQGYLVGDNTDAPGLIAALQDAGFAGQVQGGPVVVLGAGGAARAAIYAALIGLERDVYILNRTQKRAEELARQWAQPGAEFGGAEFEVKAARLPDIPWNKVDLIINASSAGLSDPGQSPLPGFDFGFCPQAAVYDMVYKPAETRLMREARAAGLRAENGLGMLAHQARLAFLAWTGVNVPVQVFLDSLNGPQP